MSIIRDMIVPNCVWVAGRTAAAVRKAAVACLWAIVRSPLLTTNQVIINNYDNNNNNDIIRVIL